MDPEERAFVQHAVASDLLRTAAQALGGARIPVMVLKGAWLHLAVLPPERLRPLSDVDLLVPEDAFERAVAVLQAQGFEGEPADARQRVMRRRGDALSVDLHRRLFDRTSFRLPTADMFARSRGPIALDGGAKVWCPDPLDGFAHLVGHAAHCRMRPRDTARMRDFADVASRFGLAPSRAASHLVGCGMRRAARYVLGAPAVGDSPFCRDVLAALPSDPLGAAIARACGWAIPRTQVARPWGGALSYLLEDNLLRAAGAMAYRSGVVLERRLRRSRV